MEKTKIFLIYIVIYDKLKTAIIYFNSLQQTVLKYNVYIRLMDGHLVSYINV